MSSSEAERAPAATPMQSSALDRLHLRDSWPWLAALAGFGVFCWLLAPILTPFVLGAGLAYAGDPFVDRLQRWGLSRTAGVSLVFLFITLLGLLALVMLVPMLHNQLAVLLENIPQWLAWLQDRGLAQLGITLPEGMRLDAESLKQVVADHWTQAGGVVKEVWRHVSASGGALLVAIANLLLVPVVTFYLLRDWDLLVAWIRNMIPPRTLPTVGTMARETDEVLGAFIRGQLTVMAALTVYYWIALWAAGLDLALLVGLIVGLISFVPYLGAIVGVLTAVIAMLVQTQELLPFVWLAVVFGVGQVLESNVLTPWLVGDKIGLHPVAVIFAVMAGGQLFGFVGVMLALPVAAVLAVLFRHAKRQWLGSRLYGHGAPAELPSQEAAATQAAPTPPSS
ncbi:AI-2E family transporter [Panacagrimonas sp.]|uniref:AI-2E family transporter n=1 Tax=Panacagrimonas sp. TaxID=2480088 RepID=UPI003B522F5C